MTSDGQRLRQAIYDALPKDAGDDLYELGDRIFASVMELWTDIDNERGDFDFPDYGDDDPYPKVQT